MSKSEPAQQCRVEESDQFPGLADQIGVGMIAKQQRDAFDRASMIIFRISTPAKPCFVDQP